MSEDLTARVTIEHGEAGRADHWLRQRFPHAPRRELLAFLERGALTRNGRSVRKGDVLQIGDVVELRGAPATGADLRPVPEELPIDVLHRDAAMIAVCKPAGMATHPLRAGERGTLANRIAHLAPECAATSQEAREGGAAHRLDHGTSGVVAFARTPAAYLELRDAFARGAVRKVYWAVTAALPDTAILAGPIAQRGDHAVVDRAGLPAQTEWRELTRGAGGHLLECKATTGRRHQIRVHLAAAGAPILGDAQYGGPPGPPELIGFFLHAQALELHSPAGGSTVRIEAPLPDDRRAALAGLGIDWPR